ncbi:mastermind-like domain-containing protein 1 [Arapaima gigas]
MLLLSQRPDAPRTEPLLPGSVKRTLAVADSSHTNMAPGASKRPCLEDVTLAKNFSYEQPSFSSDPGVGSHRVGGQDGALKASSLASLYPLPAKPNPGLPGGVGAGHGGMAPPSVEQELQDILEELTRNPDPSLPELDLEKILGGKGDELIGTTSGFMHPEAGSTPKRSPPGPSHMESQLTHSPGFPQAPSVGSPQLNSSPGGALYSLPSRLAKSVAPTQPSACSLSVGPCTRPGSGWHDTSRPQQTPSTLAASPFCSQNSQSSFLPSTAPSPPLQQSSTACSFGPQNGSGSQLLKSVMQAGQNAGTVVPKAYSLNSTKPLRHYDQDLSTPRLGPLLLGNGPSGPYTATSGGTGGNAQVLQSHQVQRGLQAGVVVPHSRAEQNPGAVASLQNPSSITRSSQGNGFNLLKTQLLRKQLMQQEKQRSMEQINGAQMSQCQQVAPLQGLRRSLPPGCGYTMRAPAAEPPRLTHNPALPSRVGLATDGSLAQTSCSLGTFLSNMGSKEAVCHHSREVSVPQPPGQGMLGLGSPPQQTTPYHQPPAQPGVSSPSFTARSLRSLPPQQHLRLPAQQNSTVSCSVLSSKQKSQPQPLWQQQQHGLLRTSSDAHMDQGLHQHTFSAGGTGGGTAQFTNTGSHWTAGPPPNQVGLRLPNRHTGHLMSSNQPLGPLSSMGVGNHCPTQGMAPPTYPSTPSKPPPSLGYSNGNPGQELPPYKFTHPSGNGHLSGGCCGVQGAVGGNDNTIDFIETLVGPREDWLNNFNMIDKYLEQNT